MGVGTVEIAFILLLTILMGLFAFGVVIAFIAWAMGLGRWSKRHTLDTEDARIMQEIYRGLRGMEERLSALETIVDGDEALARAEKKTAGQL